MKKAVLIVIAFVGIGSLLIGVTHFLFKSHGTAVAAPKPLPAGGIPVSPELSFNIGQQEYLRDQVTHEFEAAQKDPMILRFTADQDRLTGMTNRVSVQIQAEMQNLKLSPSDFGFQQDCRCFVPKTKPEAIPAPDMKK